DDLPVSGRKYPFIDFKPDREAGKDILRVEGLSKTVDGVKVLDNLTFTINKGEKTVFLCENDIAIKTLFQILAEEIEPDEGSFTFGVTTTRSYFPADNNKYFENQDVTLLDWLKPYAKEEFETYLRGFLGKVLFAGDDALKKAHVLSGGEKVRCMLARMMMSGANVLMLDEPTNHLDLESITAVNDGLIRFKGTVLFASRDHQFVQTVANRIIDIDDIAASNNAVSFDEYRGYQD
ncbi:MAG: ABC-F family ATP-binding cassette domain-containing protein, partial [Deltaproteobacteria bacterium]|nr:ABC-F family ATP-binding cassette domain-containing protein [Deltaproteobacteria bacterium]